MILSAGTPYALSATQFGDKLYLFATGPKLVGSALANILWVNIFDGLQWKGWSEVPPSHDSDAAPFATQFDNKLYLFAIANQGSVFFNVANIPPP